MDLISRFVVAEIHSPGATALNEWLHDGLLGLNRVIQVVRGPFVQKLAQSDGAKLAMLRAAAEVVGCNALQQGETRLAQAGKLARKLRR